MKFAPIGLFALITACSASAQAINLTSFGVNGDHGTALFALLKGKLGATLPHGLKISRTEKKVSDEEDPVGRNTTVTITLSHADGEPFIVCSEATYASGKKSLFGATCGFPNSPWSIVTPEGILNRQVQGELLFDLFKTTNLTQHDWSLKNHQPPRPDPAEETFSGLIKITCYKANSDDRDDTLLDECISGEFRLLIKK